MIYFFRLVNMLNSAKPDQENIWDIVKKTRLSFLSEYTDTDCYQTLLPDNNIQDNMNSLASQLFLNTTSIPKANTSHKTLELAVQMFMYLNYCPSKLLKFTASLLKDGSPKEIILAMISVIKTNKNLAEKYTTIKMFSKVMDIFSLKQYEQVQIITKGYCGTNTTLDNCTLNADITNKEVLKILGFFHCHVSNFYK